MKLMVLPFECDGKKVKNALCILKTGDIEGIAVDEILSLQEVFKYNWLRTQSGKIQYLLGRYSAKQAYIEVTSQNTQVRNIEIRNGIFEQPILNDTDFDVSIAHTEEIGVAIIFDKSFPMGIDVEVIDFSKKDILKTITTSSEIGNISVDEITALTIAWCFKEALSKALRTGLTIQLELLKTKSITNHRGYFECEFVNFAQYKGYANAINNSLIAVVYPKQISITGDL